MTNKQTKEYQEKMKLKNDIEKANKTVSGAVQFLVDIGTKKNRAKYDGSNKDLMNNKAEIINYLLKEVTTAVLLRHVCKTNKFTFKKQDLIKKAELLMKELF